MRRGSLGVALAALMIVGAGSTAPMAQDQVTIRLADVYVGANPFNKVYADALAKWQADHPEVKLVREQTPGDDHYTKIATDLAANNVPDVFFNWAIPGRMVPFIDASVAMDVRDYFAKSKVISANDWSPAQLGAVTVNDTPYGMPIASFKCFTFYNTALFDKYGQTPPKTEADLLAVSKVFNDNGIVPFETGSKGGNPGHLLFTAIVDEMPNGISDIANVPTTHNIATDSIKAAAKVVLDLRKAGVFPSDSIANGDWGPSITLYNQGKAAMLYTCPWMVAQIDPAVAATTKLMYLPTFDGAAVPGSQGNVGTVNDIWMVNKASFDDPKKQTAIVSLLDTLMGQGVKAGLMEAGNFPGWKVDSFDAYKINPLTKSVYEFTDTSPDLYGPLINAMPTAGGVTAFNDAMDKLFAGQDAETVIDDFQSALSHEY